MEKKEGKHYKKRRRTSDKKFYSVREIIPDITGIDEKSTTFESKYKEIQRIILVFRKPLGIKDSRMKIPSYQKDAVVDVLKNVYNDSEIKDTIRKIGNGVQVPIDEMDKVIRIFEEAIIKHSKTAVEQLIFQKFIKEMKGDEFYERGQQIIKEVMEDIHLADKINNHEIKMEFLNQYKILIDEALCTWRNQVNVYCIGEEYLKKLTNRNEIDTTN